MENHFEFKMKLYKENFTTLRLLVGGICSTMNYDIEKTEDIKVSVSEACLLFLREEYCGISAIFNIDKNLEVIITGCKCNNDEIKLNDDGKILSVSLLEELVDKVEFKEDNGKLCEIQMRIES